MAREDGSGTVAVGAPQQGQSAVCRAEFFSFTRARARETKKSKNGEAGLGGGGRVKWTPNVRQPEPLVKV